MVDLESLELPEFFRRLLATGCFRLDVLVPLVRLVRPFLGV